MVSRMGAARDVDAENPRAAREEARPRAASRASQPFTGNTQHSTPSRLVPLASLLPQIPLATPAPSVERATASAAPSASYEPIGRAEVRSCHATHLRFEWQTFAITPRGTMVGAHT